MARVIRNTVLYAFAALVFSSLVACSSTQPVDATPDSMASKLSIGDNLIVTTKDGQEHEFVLLDIDDNFLVGENVKLATKDIVKVERYVHEEDRTYFLLGAILLAIFLFFLSLPVTTLG